MPVGATLTMIQLTKYGEENTDVEQTNVERNFTTNAIRLIFCVKRIKGANICEPHSRPGPDAKEN